MAPPLSNGASAGLPRFLQNPHGEADMGNQTLMTPPSLGIHAALPSPIAAALEASFGQGVQSLTFTTHNDALNQGLGALASSRGRHISLSSAVPLDPADERAMEVLGHEVSHALAPVQRPRRVVSQRGDAAEHDAEATGQQFRAYADTGFGGAAPQLTPTSPSGALVHRYESDEHRRAVDEALMTLLASEAPLDVDPAEIERLTATAGPHMMSDISLANGLYVTPGDITALTGDFYAARDGRNVNVDRSFRRLNTLGNRAEMSELLGAFDRERAGEHIDPSEFESITAGRYTESYLELASANDPHFSAESPYGTDNNMGAYQAFHEAALEAGASGDRNRAYILESMAMHYLTDRHASGHLLNKRGIMENTGASSEFTGNLRALWLHDWYNEHGMMTEDASGNAWTAYGDKHWDIEANAENRYRTSISVLTSWSELGDVIDDPRRLEEMRAARGAHFTVPQFDPAFQGQVEDYARDQGALLTTRAGAGNVARTPVQGVAERSGHQTAHAFQDLADEFNRGTQTLSTPQGWWWLSGAGF